MNKCLLLIWIIFAAIVGLICWVFDKPMDGDDTNAPSDSELP